MPPIIALFLWLVLLLALFYFDPAKVRGTSIAIWIPVIWIFIIGSRLPSQWLGGSVGTQAQALEDGNPIDRAVFSILIILALFVLFSRSFNWGSFFTRNFALVAFLTFALVSVCWSDFAFISLKRWFRDLGDYLVVLVVLSETRPSDAIRTLFRYLSYLFIPLSIVLIKYYPYLGKQYSEWTGAAMFVGVTTSKNMLGVVCLVSGIFFFGDTLTRWPGRRERENKRIIAVNVAFIAMTLWLLNLADSATSRVCLAIGCLVILAIRSKWGTRHPAFIKVMVPACFFVYLIVAFGFNMMGDLASKVGRDPTLTDRTLIWQTVLSLHTNPLLGTGYESFWLGSRLQYIWQRVGQINESHNGYLELYLNLGLIGLGILIAFLVSSYRTICRELTKGSQLASLSFALWTVTLFYNMTEAAFRSQLMWLAFLVIAVNVPQRIRALAQVGIPLHYKRNHEFSAGFVKQHR